MNFKDMSVDQLKDVVNKLKKQNDKILQLQKEKQIIDYDSMKHMIDELVSYMQSQDVDEFVNYLNLLQDYLFKQINQFIFDSTLWQSLNDKIEELKEFASYLNIQQIQYFNQLNSQNNNQSTQISPNSSISYDIKVKDLPIGIDYYINFIYDLIIILNSLNYVQDILKINNIVKGE